MASTPSLFNICSLLLFVTSFVNLLAYSDPLLVSIYFLIEKIVNLSVTMILFSICLCFLFFFASLLHLLTLLYRPLLVAMYFWSQKLQSSVYENCDCFALKWTSTLGENKNSLSYLQLSYCTSPLPSSAAGQIDAKMTEDELRGHRNGLSVLWITPGTFHVFSNTSRNMKLS